MKICTGDRRKAWQTLVERRRILLPSYGDCVPDLLFIAESTLPNASSVLIPSLSLSHTHTRTHAHTDPHAAFSIQHELGDLSL